MGAEGELRQRMGAVLLGCTSSSSHFNPNFCSTNSITRLTKSTKFLIFSSLLSLLNSISARMMKLKPISRPLTLVLTLLTIAYGMFVASILSNKPLHHLLFDSPSPPPPMMMMMNRPLAIARLPSPPPPPPYAVVNESCNKITKLIKPRACVDSLMKIPSTKYATDTTQLITIVADLIYNLSLSSRFEFNRYLTVHHATLSDYSIMCLRQCEEMSEAIINYWECTLFEKHYLLKYVGTLLSFWNQARDSRWICVQDIDYFVSEEEKTTQGHIAVKEFAHSLFDEIDNLRCLGNSLSESTGILLMKLTELKPMPLAVSLYKPDPERFYKMGWGPHPTVLRVYRFFSWLTSVLSSAAKIISMG